MFSYTGDYFEHTTTSVPCSTYYTFTPRSLMDGDFYTLDDELVGLLSETHQTLGLLAGMMDVNPCAEQIRDAILLKEAYFSKMIDNPTFDISSFIYEHGADATNDCIQNIVSAYCFAVSSKLGKLNYNDLFSRALHGEEAKKKSFTRREPLFLKGATANFRQYNPTAPMQITKSLDGMQEYLSISQTDILIKAALYHYQFEIIHPFPCFNGVVGRILNSKILADTGLGFASYLSISHILFQQKSVYFEKLSLAQRNGDYRGWIEFFIKAVLDAAKTSIQFVKEFRQFTTQDKNKILSKQSRQDHTLEVYRYFTVAVVSGTQQVSDALSLSFKSASRAIEILKEMGILEQITKGARNRKFAHKAMLRHLTM